MGGKNDIALTTLIEKSENEILCTFQFMFACLETGLIK